MRKTVHESKRESWRTFASTLSSRKPGTEVWNTLKGLDGRARKQLPRTPIIQGTKVAKTNREKANMAMATYAAVRRVLVESGKQKNAYQSVRKRLKETPIEHETAEEFTMAELEGVLKTTKNSACGEDGISPVMLKNLPDVGEQQLWRPFNTSWNEGRVPTAWKKQ